MRIYIQWAKSQAEDWQPLEVRSNQVIASMSDELYTAHRNARTAHGWREWLPS